MRGLLIAATELEIWPVMETIREHENWDLLITGVGGVQAAYRIMQHLSKNRPDLMLQVGIAGSLDVQWPISSVVTVEMDCFGDLGVVENEKRRSVFDLGLIPSNEKPFQDGWLINSSRDLISRAGLETARAVTVNEITTNPNDIRHFREVLGASVESQEGAAFHYVALMEHIPFLQIRGISNVVGERDKKKWEIEKAVQNLASVTNQFIQTIYS
jgi:futalosine hydrolase